MNRQQTKGVVLRRQEYGEADRILTILTADLGKVSAIAKGVRRLKSKLASGVELFIESDFTLLRGRSSMYTVISVKPDTVFNQVAEDYGRMQTGAHYLQWMHKLVEDEEGQELFPLLHQALESLNHSKIEPRVVTAWLQMQLLMQFGHEPNISSVSSGERLQENDSYVFIIEDGVFEPGRTGTPFTANDIKTWRLLMTTGPVQLQQVRGVTESLQKTAPVLDQFFMFHTNI